MKSDLVCGKECSIAPFWFRTYIILINRAIIFCQNNVNFCCITNMFL